MSSLAKQTNNKDNNESNDNFMAGLKSKRLFKDIIDMEKNTLVSEGVFYKHDYNNIQYGYAAIVGPKDTPYENGVYVFKFKFKNTYPYEPPVLTYLTNDGKTRFNPNLYRSGKVCISILNTWRGERWSACQSIRSVLMMILTVLNDTPFLNEPGIKKTNKDYDDYNDIITYKNFERAIFKNYMLCMKEDVCHSDVSDDCWPDMRDFMVSHFILKKNEILSRYAALCDKQAKYLKKHKIKSETKKSSALKKKVSIYGMNFIIDYTNLNKYVDEFKLN